MGPKKKNKGVGNELARVSATERLGPYLYPQRPWIEPLEVAGLNDEIVAPAVVDEPSSPVTETRDFAVEPTPVEAEPILAPQAPADAPEPARDAPWFAPLHREEAPPAPAPIAPAPVAAAPIAPTPPAPEPVAAPAPVAAPVRSVVSDAAAASGSGLRAALDKAPVDVAAMFDRVAARYDLVNDVLALGQTRIWRSLVVRAVNPRPGDRILDLAAGTGTSSAPFAARGAEVVPCDFSFGMLEVGKRRQPSLPFVAGDALNLPFRDDAFDAVTISFGLRNVQDTERALREMLRVTKPGGKIVVCEFSTPVFGPLRTLYMEYLMRALPVIAQRTSSNPAAYVYLSESIREWPRQADLAKTLQATGWQRVQWRNATGGIVAIHRGYKASK